MVKMWNQPVCLSILVSQYKKMYVHTSDGMLVITKGMLLCTTAWMSLASLLIAAK
jgi:hypothetical protein